MKIDLNYVDRNSFHVDEHVWNGQVVYLVTPKMMGCEWTQENKIFRSSVWNDEGELISASFPKFVNWGEKPEVFPLPSSLKNATIMEKVDGSTLIVSKYKGNYMIRTRGTIDAGKMEKNGHEIEIFKNEILPKFGIWLNEEMETWKNSFIFEWTSPLNTIVINYGDKPTFSLIGIIQHDSYSLWNQENLDIVAASMGFPRPATYTFTTIEDLLASVEKWEGKEGVCVYHHDGQEIHKCKSADYLLKHRFKSQATLENTLDIYFQFNQPTYQEFEAKLIEMFDYECFSMVRGYASSICDAAKQVKQIVNGITKFILPLKTANRRIAAESIISSYGNTGRSAMAFTLLDGKELSNDQMKKLFWQCLKSKSELT